MRWVTVFFVVANCVTSIVNSASADIRGPYFGPEGAYLVFETETGPTVSWLEARLAAADHTPPDGYGTGHLLSISGPDEQQFINDNVNFALNKWIGFVTDAVTGNGFGEWHWIDDTPGIWQDPRMFNDPIQTAYTNWQVDPFAPNDNLDRMMAALITIGTSPGHWDDAYGDYNGYVVEFEPEILGDTNSDGFIDIIDLNNVRNNFGVTGPDDGTLPGDAFPFDGFVNIIDLNGVRNNFGASATVPEPSTLALASLFAFVAVIARRRRG